MIGKTNYFITHVVYTLFFFAIHCVLSIYLPILENQWLYLSLFVCSIIYYIIFIILLKVAINKSMQFINWFMLLSTLKLFLFVVVIGLVFYSLKKQGIIYVVYLMILYLFFTILDVIRLVSFIKKQQDKS